MPYGFIDGVDKQPRNPQLDMSGRELLTFTGVLRREGPRQAGRLRGAFGGLRLQTAKRLAATETPHRGDPRQLIPRRPRLSLLPVVDRRATHTDQCS